MLFRSQIVLGLGGKVNGIPRETGFDITAASEVMAIVAVSRDLADYCHDRLQAWHWLKDAATHPVAAPIEVPAPPAGAEDAMRRGAEQAIARAIQLLTNQEA